MAASSVRILVVDDDPTLRELLEDTLSSIGYTVESAPDGFAALDRLAHASFDLVITDIRMPGMDGITLHKKIRRLYPDIPVLFITGVASPEIIGQASPVGFLAKPFRIQHIEELIADALHWRNDRMTQPIKRVMVVDDDDLFREMLTDTLAAHGFTPCSAQNGAQALAELKNGPVDVVITDIKMPGMDGLELLREIKTNHPSLPVILITAFLSEEPSVPPSDQPPASSPTTSSTATNPEATTGPGSIKPDGFLRKPFDIDRIIELLDSLAPQ